MSSDQTFAIVGVPLAEAKAAETLCRAGFDGRVLRLGAGIESKLAVLWVAAAAGEGRRDG
jgi:hypothetical protein